jgi:5-methylcytosine-specific restriction enzyme subunit McrC
MVEIPILNIYYLLSYAWDKLEEKNLVNVESEAYKTLPDLFAKVLANGLRYLFKKGLDRDYIAKEDQYPGIKGKLLLAGSVKSNSFISGKAYCSFDEFDYDVLHNRILKATLKQLLHFPDLDPAIRNEIKLLYQRFHNVSDVRIQRRDFSQVILHRNNSFYKFLLNVALVIHDNLLFDPAKGTWTFKDFLRDETKMAALFEKFIFNFYKRQIAHGFTVAVEIIKWQAEAIETSSLEFLPVMRTDISLTNDTRKIIIDAKYYKDAMLTRFDQAKFRSEHFYQMFAYMSNLDVIDNEGKQIEGILVYPTVQQSFHQSYKVKNYKLRFSSLNLASEWRSIEQQLLDLLLQR